MALRCSLSSVGLHYPADPTPGLDTISPSTLLLGIPLPAILKTRMTSFALLALIAYLGISLVPVYLLRRGGYARAQDYFVASEPTPSGVMRNGSIGYSLQVATFGLLFGWGAKGEFWPAILFSAMFGTGLYLIYRLRRRLLTFTSRALDRDQSVTVSGFIARQHGNDARLRVLAALLSVCAFAGLTASAAIGVASLLKTLLPDVANITVPIACVLLGLMLLYAVPAGNSGAMRSAQAHLGVVYIGLITSILIVLYMLLSSAGRMPPHGTLAVTALVVCCAIVLLYRRSRYIDTSPMGGSFSGEVPGAETFGASFFRRFSRVANEVVAFLAATTAIIALIALYFQGGTAVLTDSISALHVAMPFSISGLLALILLPIFYPIVDTTNWLRLTALEIDKPPVDGADTKTPETFARVLAMYAGASALVWLLICAFGAIAALATGTPDSANILGSFIVRLVSQQTGFSDAASWLLLASVVAMAVLTGAAMFSAISAILRYDVVPVVWSSLAADEAQPSGQAQARRRAVIAGSAVCALVLAVLFLLNGHAELSFTSGWFFALQLACVCLQLAFVPLVLGPLAGGNSATVSPAWAVAVLCAGIVAGQCVIVASLQTGHPAWLWSAVPACLGSGSSLYAVALLRINKTGPKA